MGYKHVHSIPRLTILHPQLSNLRISPPGHRSVSPGGSCTRSIADRPTSIIELNVVMENNKIIHVIIF